MKSEKIKTMLETGLCPECQSEIITKDGMKSYFCSKDISHFNLEIEFEGGEKIIAKLNGEEIPPDELIAIEW